MERMATDLRQEQIINTAMKIINENGFLAFTMRSLAETIGVSEPALYRHFKSKDQILIGILQKMDELWSEIEPAVNNKENYIEKLQLFMRMHFNFIQNHSDIVSILFADEFIRWNEAVKSYLYDVQSKRFVYLTTMIDEGVGLNAYKNFNSKITAVIILSTIRATILNWRNSSQAYSLTKHGEEVIATIIEMVTCQ